MGRLSVRCFIDPSLEWPSAHPNMKYIFPTRYVQILIYRWVFVVDVTRGVIGLRNGQGHSYASFPSHQKMSSS